MSLTSRRTAMARKRYKPEEIVAKLRQVDVLVSQGQKMADAIRQIGVSEMHRTDTEVDVDQAGCEHDAKITAKMPCNRGAESTMSDERTYASGLEILGGSIILLNWIT